MATLREVYEKAKATHFRVTQSAGSIGIIGIIAFIIACVLLWKQFLGRLSVPVAVVIFFLIPLLGL